MSRDACVLVLGGAGLVGSQIVREAARRLTPQKIIVASLHRGEVRDFLRDVQREFPHIEFVGAWGNVFVRSAFESESRSRLLERTEHREQLYDDLFGDIDDAYAHSALVQLVQTHRPDVIVDCINTATAISYQDVTRISKKTHDNLAALQHAAADDEATRDAHLKRLEQNVSLLLISQATSQLIRHVRIFHQAMCEVGTRLYLKIGTTGTGGMGLNIPYTHSEDKPSVQLMTKTAMAFAHTGLMFLMARTPDGPLVKELKPAAMIGYREVSHHTIKKHGKTQYLYQSKVEALTDRLVLEAPAAAYPQQDKLQMAGVDTGENGFFARGEFETITYIDQMEFLTPEEIAEQVVLEIKGSNTGYDIIAGLDSNIINPTYRAGVLRHTALEKLARIEEQTQSHSVALGQLGPPELSKLLYEAYLLKRTYGTLVAVQEATPQELSDTLYGFLHEEDYLRQTIISIGLPILAPNGTDLIRGPRINIPEHIYPEIDVRAGDLDQWARKGWVDLRQENMAVWRQRFARMQRSRHMLHTRGTSSITRTTYLYETIEIGAVAAWIFTNEEGGYRIK